MEQSKYFRLFLEEKRTNKLALYSEETLGMKERREIHVDDIMDIVSNWIVSLTR